MFAHTLPIHAAAARVSYGHGKVSAYRGECAGLFIGKALLYVLRRELPQLSVVHHIDNKGVISNQFCFYDRRDLISGDLRMRRTQLGETFPSTYCHFCTNPALPRGVLAFHENLRHLLLDCSSPKIIDARKRLFVDIFTLASETRLRR